MRRHYQPAATYLALLTLFLLPICGCGGGDATTTVAIDAPEEGDASGAPAAAITPEPPPEPVRPEVEFVTSMGRIVLRLEREKVQQTVDNFVKHVQNGHYKDTIFHQVVKDRPSVLVGGLFLATQAEKPLATAPIGIYCEADNGLPNRRGTISMSRLPGNPHSATCGFFINVSDNEAAFDPTTGYTPDNYGYCAFGEVIEGMDVIDKIAAVETESAGDFDRIPVTPVVIESARVIK